MSRAAFLLGEVHRRHDARDPAGIAALFAADGALWSRGRCRARGPAEIERLLRERVPHGALVLGDPAPQRGGAVAATYGWSSSPGVVAGEVRLQPDGDHIGRLDLFPLPVPKVPRDRVSVRAVLVAPGPSILLFRCGEPGKGDVWWIAPGGGRDPGEDDLAALRRELLEEVGVAIDTLGPCLWTRTHTFVWREDVLRQHERFFLVELPAEVVPAPTHPDDGSLGHRWWSPAELAATDEILVPRRLAELVCDVLRDGPPSEPLDGGV